MPALTVEDKLEYVISALRHLEDLPIDFHKVAAEHNIVNANKAQIKFKKIIDDTGKFKLTAGKVVAVDGSDGPATPAKKSAGRPKKAAAEDGGSGKSAGKKRKVQEVETEVEEEETEA